MARPATFRGVDRRGIFPLYHRDLLTREGVFAFGVALRPTVNQIFERMRAAQAAEIQRQIRRNKEEAGCVGMKC